MDGQIRDVSYVYFERTAHGEVVHTDTYIPKQHKREVDYVMAYHRTDTKDDLWVVLMQRGPSMYNAARVITPGLLPRGVKLEYVVAGVVEDDRLDWADECLGEAPELCSKINDIFENGWKNLE